MALFAQVSGFDPAKDNITWHSFSKDASGSMPVGGGDIGLNVWTESGDVLFYIAKSDAFDQNNTLLKLGRVRIHLMPDPFTGSVFSQTLQLADGSVYIKGQINKKPVTLHLWVDVYHPVIHASIRCSGPKAPKLNAVITYESWRDKDNIVKGRENNQNSYKFGPQGVIRVKKDSITTGTGKALGGYVQFFHRNPPQTVFDVAVRQQGLESVKNQLYNPLGNRISGGILYSRQLQAAGIVKGRYQRTDYTGYVLKTTKAVSSLNFNITLLSQQTPAPLVWTKALRDATRSPSQTNEDWSRTKSWWQDFWRRSFIDINPGYRSGAVHDSLQTLSFHMGRNYQLFRYMLACNAYGNFPTKFNGGLFTYDPVLVDSAYPYTPDFRNWGGGTFTQQNQRLVYYPLLKSGDYDMMQSSFAFYNRLLKTAELRSMIYWHHKGAAFTEQLENYGLPNPSEYGWKRPQGFDPGMQYNAWLEYEWDTVLEFCDMILKSRLYNSKDISAYMPLIKSCLRFFDKHYEYLAQKRGARILDSHGHLILYPGSAAETYKLAYNASSTIAALKTVTRHLLALPRALLDSADRKYFIEFSKKIPPIHLGQIKGQKVITPAVTWARINNQESPQLYPVFPWAIYGVGRPHLDIALNTWNLDTNVIKNRSYIGWKQDNIFAARMGLHEAAFKLTAQKLMDSPRRFPTFWGPGFDWVPDHNWGGSAMIGLQEMLLQNVGDSILLFPAWNKKVDVHFKLHAPHQTTVEAWLEKGKLKKLIVLPADRQKNVFNYLDRSQK